MNCSTVGGVIRSAGGESNNPFSSIFHFSKPLDWLGNKARRAVCAQQQRKILTVIKATSKCRASGPRMAQNLIHVTWRMDRVCTPNGRILRLESHSRRCQCHAEAVEHDPGLRFQWYVVISECSSSSSLNGFSPPRDVEGAWSIGDSENLFWSRSQPFVHALGSCFVGPKFWAP